MSGDVKALKSYLVSLGFDANMSQFAKFESVLKDAKSLVKKTTGEMALDFIKTGVVTEGVLTAIGAAAAGVALAFVGITSASLGMIAKLGEDDQEFRLFGQRMLLNTEQARSLKISLDALGQPIEAIAFDPELHSRYEQLQKDQASLSAGLGGDFEGTMKQIRDVMFEFTRLEVEFKYFMFSVAKDVFQALGGGDFTKNLHELNDWIIGNIPKWSREFSTYLVPVLKVTLDIFKDLAILFIRLEPLILIVLESFKVMLDVLVKITDAISSIVGTIPDAYAKAQKSPLMSVANAVGSVAKEIYDPFVSGGSASLTGSGSGVTADQARTLAGRVGAQLGVDPSIVYAQWAHETGNFTNRGARSLNNLGGIENADGTYRSFSSLNDFGSYYTGLIQRKYSGALGATSTDDYASALKRGGYFADSLGNYERGMRSFQGSYGGGGGSSASVSVGDIHIAQPGLTNDQVGNIVVQKIQEHVSLQTKRSLAQTRTAYA